VRVTNIDASFTFAGFMLQARTENGGTIGRFIITEPSLMRFVPCGGFPADSVLTHTSAVRMFQIQVDWEAPAGYLGNVRI
jgi:hypothetical protein